MKLFLKLFIISVLTLPFTFLINSAFAFNKEIDNYCLEQWDGNLNNLDDHSCEEGQIRALEKLKTLVNSKDHYIFESCLKLRPVYTKVLECSIQQLETSGPGVPTEAEQSKRFTKNTRFHFLFSKPQYAGEEREIKYSYNF